MFKMICKDCAKLTVAGIVGYAVTRLVRRRHEDKRPRFVQRLIPH